MWLASAQETPVTPFSSYSEEEINALQRYHDALRSLHEAKEAYNATEDPFEKAGKHEAVQMAQAAAEEATAALNMLPNASDLLRTYNEWFAEQGDSGFKLDIPVGVSEESEGEIQSTVAGYDIEGLAQIYASGNSEALIQAALDAMDLSVDVRLNPVGDLGLDGSHASGLDRVPFDGYRALLHKDEAVLTAAEAAVWRRGMNWNESASPSKRNDRSNASEQPVTVNLTVNGSSGSPYEIAGAVRDALEMVRWGV